MLFISRSKRAAGYTAVRVGLFFFAAGLWLAGVRVGSSRITAAAIAVAAVAILFGLVLRRLNRQSTEEQADSSGEA